MGHVHDTMKGCMDEDFCAVPWLPRRFLRPIRALGVKAEYPGPSQLMTYAPINLLPHYPPRAYMGL